ncbi:MAG: hypothetical protein ACRCYU_23445 [Nocardioides sp.]
MHVDSMSARRLGGGRHVWVYRTGYVAPGLLTEWRQDRAGSGWSGLVTFTGLDDRGAPAVFQQWIWAENLDPVGDSDPPPFRPVKTRRDLNREPPPYG